MELFKITCVTCRARLSVRDASLIGQIIGCPRCGMMVQVTAPASGASLTPPVAATVTSVVAAAAVVAPQPSSFADASLEAGPIAPPPLASPATFDDATLIDAPHDAAASAAAPPAPPVAAPAFAAWSSYKFAAILVGAALAGSAIAAAALSWLDDDDQVATAAANPAPAVAPAAKQSSEATPSPATSPDPAPNDEVAASAASDPAAEAFLPVEDPEPTEPAAAPAAEPAPANADAATAATPPAPDAVANADESTPPVADVPPSEAAPAPRLRIDPLDVDPEGLNLSTLYSGPPKDPLAESQLPNEEEPADSVPPRDPQPGEGEAAAAAPKGPGAVRRDERGGVGAPIAAPLLARRLTAVKLDKMPLCRLLDLSVQMSGMPVSASPDELRMAAVSAATPASVDVKNATLEMLLTSAMAPLRLKPAVDGQQVVLKRVGDDKRRTVEYPVDDLARSAEKVEQLANWVQQLAAPQSWQASGGDATLAVDRGKLRIDAPVSVHYEVLFVLERYRVTRGLPTRTKYPSTLLPPGAFHAAVADRLAAPAVFTFTQYTPLREIFRFWQEELDVAVLVDWPGLAEERQWPNGRIACSAADKTWAEAMDSVLEPLGLAWRAVDRNTIEITTATKVRTEPMLEVYRIAPNASIDAEQLVARVQSLVAADTDPQATTGIAYDAESRVLLVRQPAAAHRKLVAELSDVLVATADSAR